VKSVKLTDILYEDKQTQDWLLKVKKRDDDVWV